MPTESLKFKSTMDDSAFQAALNRMGTGVEKAGAKITSIGKGIGAGLIGATGLGALMSGGKIFEGLKSVYEGAHQMEMLSRRTGESVESLYLLKQATIDTGIDMDTLATSIGRMQRQLADGNDEFKALGLSIGDLKEQSPFEQFQAIGKAIANLPSATERAAAAMRIFGRSGTELLKVFLAPEFKNASNVLSEKSKILVANSEMFAETAVQLAKAGRQVSAFFTGLASEAAPPLLEALKSFNAADFASSGKQFGAYVATAADALKLASDYFVSAMEKAGNGLRYMSDMLGFTQPLAPTPPGSFPSTSAAKKFVSDFWKSPKAGTDFFNGGMGNPNSPFMSPADSGFFNPFGAAHPLSPRFGLYGKDTTLEEWASRMGHQTGPYGGIESSSRAERRARAQAARDRAAASDGSADSEDMSHAHHFVRSRSRDPKAEKTSLSEDTISKLKAATKEANKELIAE